MKQTLTKLLLIFIFIILSFTVFSSDYNTYIPRIVNATVNITNNYISNFYNTTNTTNLAKLNDISQVGNFTLRNGSLLISLNSADPTSSLIGTAISARGADNGVVRIATSSYGIAGIGSFANRHARGTAASLSAVQRSDVLISLEGWGYAGTSYSTTPSVMVRGHASQTWTDTKQGAYLSFYTTANDTVVPQEQWRITESGDFVSDGNGAITRNIITNGTIFTKKLNVSQDSEFFGNVVLNDGFTLNHTYWDDITTNLLSTIVVSGKSPTLTQFRNNTYAYAFADVIYSQENSQIGSIQMSHSYKFNTNIECHIHWSCGTTSVNNVTWGLEYTLSNINSIFPTSKEIYVTGSCGTAYTHNLNDFHSIGNFTGLSGIINYRIFRASSKITDNYAGNDVFGLNFDCHYEKDTLGSYSEYSKY